MHTTVTTVITSRINLDTFKPEHSVSIEPEDDGLPNQLIFAVVKGACRATLNSLDASDETEDDDPDEE